MARGRGDRRQLAVLALAACSALACSEDHLPAGPRDAGADAPFLGSEPTPLTPPGALELPSLTPCPTHWRAVADEEVPEIVTCDPWPEGGRPDCPPGRAFFPGDVECSRVGAAECPTGAFAEGLPETGVFYVQEGAVGGDGSIGLPFGRIADGIGAADAAGGGIVAIGRGRYDGVVRVPGGVTLWGACPTETIVHASDARVGRGVVEVWGDDVTIRDLTIGPSALVGVNIDGPYRVAVSGVIVREVRWGLFVLNGAHLDAERLLITGCNASRGLGGTGYAIDVESGSTATIDRLVSKDNEGGVAVFGIGSDVMITDAAFLDGRPGAVSDESGGAQAVDGAHLNVERSIAEHCRGTGFGAFRSSRLDVAHVVARDTIVVSGGFGNGFAANTGAEIRGSRATSDRNGEYSVLAANSATIDLDDLVVRDTRPDRGGAFGDGLRAQEGGHVLATRVAVLRSGEAAATANNRGSTLLLDHFLARSTLGRSTGRDGWGLRIFGGAEATVLIARIEESRAGGAWVAEGSALSLEDAIVADSRGDGRGLSGNGLVAQGTVVIRRARFERNREVGVFAGARSDVTLEDVSVAMTLERACAASTCPDDPAGIGVGVYDLGRLSAERFSIVRSALCGLQIATGGTATLRDGLVAENPIGACVQVPGFPTTQITTEVRYQDNARNVVTDEPVPIPEPPTP